MGTERILNLLNQTCRKKSVLSQGKRTYNRTLILSQDCLTYIGGIDYKSGKVGLNQANHFKAIIIHLEEKPFFESEDMIYE